MQNAKFIEYIWLGGKGELRSKTRVVESCEQLPSPYIYTENTFPETLNWNYDGSSCYQAEGEDSEITLKPKACYNNPWGSPNHFLFICDTYRPDGTPTESNTRHAAAEVFSKSVLSLKPRFGIEHEFFVIDNSTGYPLGYAPEGTEAQGKYYCGVGAGRAIGREFLSKALHLASKAGVKVTGSNFEVAPGQMEIQVCNYGIRVGDDSLALKYILERLGETYNYSIDFSAKPLKGDWNGSGCHINFSTSQMMDPTKGRVHITEFIEKLRSRHQEHIAVYGSDNRERLTGKHETSDMDTFSFGVANRTASIRIPRNTDKYGFGYIEDRRPSGSVDIYTATSRIYQTYLDPPLLV